MQKEEEEARGDVMSSWSEAWWLLLDRRKLLVLM